MQKQQYLQLFCKIYLELYPCMAETIKIRFVTALIRNYSITKTLYFFIFFVTTLTFMEDLVYNFSKQQSTMEIENFA